MTELEKLITTLCEFPSLDLEGDEDISVRYATGRPDQPLVVLEGWETETHLNPSQALALMDWLKEQRENLETLQEALRAKQIEDASTKEQREAERINALKALHSEAVTAWQDGGSKGPCPTLKDIVFREQFVEVSLGVTETTPATFVKQYPMLERLRKERQG